MPDRPAALILLVEDNPGDVELLRESLEANLSRPRKFAHRITYAKVFGKGLRLHDWAVDGDA